MTQQSTRWMGRRIAVTVLAILVGLVASILYLANVYAPPEAQGTPSYLSRINSQFMKAGGFRIHYIHRGSGAPVVLLPGGYLWIYQYRKIVPALAEHFSVYAFDLPGNGYSAPVTPHPSYSLPAMAHVVTDFLNQLGLKQVTLVGQSWGGGIALYVAEQHPDRVAKLVLIAATGSGLDIPDPFTMHIFKWPVVGEIASKFITKGMVRSMLQRCIYDDTMVTDEMVRQVYIPLTFTYARRMTYQMYRQLNWRLTARHLARIQAPTLLIWGARDEIEPLKAGQVLERRIPQAELIVLERAKHCVTEDRPKVVVRLITGFITGQLEVNRCCEPHMQVRMLIRLQRQA